MAATWHEPSRAALHTARCTPKIELPLDKRRRYSLDGLMPQSDFADMLRRHRFAAGLSQEELARRAGISGDAVAALERGRRRAPRPLTVRLLADALELSGEQRQLFISSARQRPRPEPAANGRSTAVADDFIGRTSELAHVVDILTQPPGPRLLTLTGPAGVGKTRLAIEAAGEVMHRSSGIVSWAALGSCTDEVTVTTAVATALGLTVSPEHAQPGFLSGYLQNQQAVIFLDNCEHVIDAAAALSENLIRECAQVRLVATSRETLRIPGETVLTVQPLALSDAARMFTLRAAAHAPPVTDSETRHVREVCRRLEGLPLAIELAAARVNVLTIEQIARELRSSFRVLGSGSRTAPKRQQTLHAAIAWSYDLLSPAEQVFLADLSVFSGGWTIAAAQAVSTERSGPDPSPVIDAIGRLADKSLVNVLRAEGEARYDMFGVIREFAAGQLDRANRCDEVEQHHAIYFIDLAEEAETELHGPEHRDWLTRLDLELDNFRIAMKRSLERRRPVLALKLAGALYTYCYLRGHYTEGRGWLDAALSAYEHAGPAPEHARWHAKALLGAGYLAFLQCDYDVAQRMLETARVVYGELGDRSGTGLTLRYLGSVARERGDYATSADLHRKSLAVYDELDDAAGSAWAVHHLAFVAWLRAAWDIARQHARDALERFRRLGDGEGIVWSLINLGVVELYTENLQHARVMLEQALSHAEEEGFREGIAWCRNQLGVLATCDGDLDRATDLLDAGLDIHQELGDQWRAASTVEAIAAVMVRRDQAKQAVVMLGAAAAARHRIGAPVPVCEAPAHQATLTAARAELDDDAFDAAWQRGRETPLHQI
nr:tetratricopeptide repeat protein [Phytoactinopolyspora alkaliphila]